MSTTEQAAENTDREIWREREGDYYSDAVFITVQNGLGIDVGGTVFVKPLRKWQELAVENDHLRAALEPFAALGSAKGGSPSAEKIRAIIGMLIETSPEDGLDLVAQFAANCLAARHVLSQHKM